MVNCAGIGARLLAQDLTVTPVRGQVVLVAQTGLERWWLDESGQAASVVPRSRDIVVGGTDDEAAASIPTTLALASTSGPPESPGCTLALTWIMSVSVSALPPFSSDAVIC